MDVVRCCLPCGSLLLVADRDPFDCGGEVSALNRLLDEVRFEYETRFVEENEPALESFRFLLAEEG